MAHLKNLPRINKVWINPGKKRSIRYTVAWTTAANHADKPLSLRFLRAKEQYQLYRKINLQVTLPIIFWCCIHTIKALGLFILTWIWLFSLTACLNAYDYKYKLWSISLSSLCLKLWEFSEVYMHRKFSLAQISITRHRILLLHYQKYICFPAQTI